MSDDQKWESLDIFRMSDETAHAVIADAPGCAASWVKKDGHPLSVWISHAVLDGDIYVTTTENRPKTVAWKKDPRTSLVFAIPGRGAVTVVGSVALVDDTKLRRRFLENLVGKMGLEGSARENWLKAMDTDGRLVGKVEIDRLITFDETKLQY